MYSKQTSRVSLVAVFYLCCCVCGSIGVVIKGLSPEDLQTLKITSTHFTCRDGTKTIPLSRVNDDFCDCLDGTDEPGTPACPNGFFYCENKGHHGKKIFSSKVYDTICDCCDGSDEKAGACPNYCGELKELELKDRKEQLKNYRKGLRTKKSYIEQAKDELALKQIDLKAKESILEELMKQKAEAEGKRDEIKKQEDQIRAEFEEKRKLEEQQRKEQEELQKQQQDEQAQNQEEEKEEVAKEQPSEETQEQRNEEDQYQPVEEEVAPEEYTDSEEAAEIEEPEELQSITEERKKLDDSVRDLQNSISNHEREMNKLKDMLNQDFGTQKEFYPLYGKCFSTNTAEYTYEVCPFDRVSQKQLNGHSTTSLGQWKSPEEWKSSKSIMKYTNGQKCWGGPDRSTTIEILCGAENQVSDPQEPNKCEYTMKLYTPAACDEEHAQVLLNDLEIAMEGKFSDDEIF